MPYRPALYFYGKAHPLDGRGTEVGNSLAVRQRGIALVLGKTIVGVYPVPAEHGPVPRRFR